MSENTDPEVPEVGADADVDPGASGMALADEPPTSADPLLALQRENAELRDQLLRRRADFDNYRRRMERERAAAGHDARADLLRELVPTLDNLERALLAAAADPASLREGVLLIQRGLLAALEAHGLTIEDPRGARFDPQRHQALSYDDAPGHDDGTVVQVFGRGYFHKERLLRPALVQVARGVAAPEAPADAQAPAPQDGNETLH